MVRSLAVILLCVVLLAPVPAAFATSYEVGPNGTVTVDVPASQYINVWARGSGQPAKLYENTGGPANNEPNRYVLSATNGGLITNQEVTFGPYTTTTTVQVRNGPGYCRYSVGALAAIVPVVLPEPIVAETQQAPVTKTTTATALTTDLMAKIVSWTQSSGATETYTLPTGTLADAAAGLSIDQCFDWVLINLSSTGGSTVTVAAGTGHTIVGNALVAISASGRFRTRKTAANTFITYRIN